MIAVRNNVFETNSSSTHSITMCSENDYNKWKKGELFYNKWEESFYTKQEIIEKAKEKQMNYIKKKQEGNTLYHYQEKYIEAKNDEELYDLEYEEDGNTYYSYDKFWDYIESEFEAFENEYKTSSGEKVIAFGYFGYDG